MRFVLLFHFCRMLPVCATGTYDSESISSVSDVEDNLTTPQMPRSFLFHLAYSAPQVPRLRSSGSSLINPTTDSLSEEGPTG
ncbi:hypothetical protein DEU56DRAFT_834858 [Suillus clintonianus]|uniref:uncharacterized protein n=1 Tax=Suillus clintonianus TaxID=1904413 RepID=UPI001B885341|nr:uncharacterized protein DEU56DRAFT_834858 [Suillus clintonianus]KAG2121229.1 hypothetical protein DEU56DRAFT_834858 [Suillus clintonianus]